MVSFLELAFIALTCAVAPGADQHCIPKQLQPAPAVAGNSVHRPVHTGEAVDVVLSAAAALAWDMETGEILYEKNSAARRPVASLSKLLSVLVVRDQLSLPSLLTIPPEAISVQRRGAHIRLPRDEHVTVQELLAASLIASANDAMVTLALGVADSEAAFVERANAFARTHGLRNTQVGNATGLSGENQYSTAEDVRQLFIMVAADPALAPLLNQPLGTLTTQEGTRRQYESTNQLLDTYVPIIAAKTGYTTEAGENLVISTPGKQGQKIGAVVLGSANRFQDMKILVEWVWRNYTWRYE